jgi:hypothetical protein
MSESLRIALVAEGPTDKIVIDAALRSMLGEREFRLTPLQPEDSDAFGPLGGGWGGVYRWCKQAVQRGAGRLSGDRGLFQIHQLLIVHLDADVAGKTYQSANIVPTSGDGTLRCEKPCPPPTDTTDVLRSVLLGWCGEASTPAQVVICMPSKSTEAWVIASLYPNDSAVANGIECHPDPEARLRAQPKKTRIEKKQADYQRRAADLEQAWPRIASAAICGEALRFQTEMTRKLPPA